MNTDRQVKGFSFIELVAVILLLAILATVVLPRWTTRDGFAEYALRDQWLAAFRLAQQRAMSDRGSCYALATRASGFGAQREGVSFGAIGEVTYSGDYKGFSVTRAGSSDDTFSLFFDGLGNVYQTDCRVNAVAAPLTVSIQPGDVTMTVYSTGFAQAE
jgi:MSHA pilin protein MshC